MNKIVVFTEFDHQIDILEEKDIINKAEQLDSLSKEEILKNIKKYDSKDLILIHNRVNLQIGDYNTVYFSFGCSKCGDFTKNGKVILDIIKAIKDKELTKQQVVSYRKKLTDLLKPKKAQKSLENKERDLFVLKYKDQKPPLCSVENSYLYICDTLNMDKESKEILSKIKTPSTKEEIKAICRDRDDFIYLLVPFAGYGYPSIVTEDGNIDSINQKYNKYFLELKELQEESDFNIIFLFLSYDDRYIPNFFKDIKTQKDANTIEQRVIDSVFVSPLKSFNSDNHNKFLFAELIYQPNKELINFFQISNSVDVTKIKEYIKYNMIEDGLYKELKRIYYKGLFFDKAQITDEKIKLCRKYERFYKDLKYSNLDNSMLHDFDLADIRTSMPFYISSIINKLGNIKRTFKNQQLDFLLVDDEKTMSSKEESIDKILLTLFQNRNRYKLHKEVFSKEEFTKDKQKELISIEDNKQNIRNSNFILVDFILDPKDNIFFGSDFIERIEKTKKEEDEQFRSWYFITSYLSNYIHKFEMDKIMYEYYDSATVQIGDSTHKRFEIFFIKKLIYFIYSKANIYIRIIKITDILKKKESKKLIKKLIIFIQTLLQQKDLLEIRYDNIKKAKQFYSLVLHILQDYLYNIDYKIEVKEIKFQEIKRLYKKLKKYNNKEIENMYQLVKIILFKRIR